MNTSLSNSIKITTRKYASRIAAALLMTLSVVQSAYAIDSYKLQELVERARFTLEVFNSDVGMQKFREFVPYAHAMIIVPDYIKGAFGIGFSGGRGVLIMRDNTTGEWSYPAFYSLRSASIGLQIGGSNAEMILMVMTEEGLNTLNNTSITLGADASVAAGPVGYGVEGETPMTFSADFASFSRTKGAFMGASLSGSTLVVKTDWNEMYYGRPVEPRDVLMGRASNPRADGLREAAAKFFNDNAR
ncbi:MAG: hypothetical protein DHS20C01_34620 [marine bacterium B5-7]|nr:MAG: hypothetical protein DHS20C01_34620 [marine bacterium B5-7]